MASKTKKKVDTESNEVLQTQIDLSVNIARDLVNSWLPPGGSDSEDDDAEVASYTKGRPGRIGLGASFLSHAQATRHNQPSTIAGPVSAAESKFRNKILNQNAAATRKRRLDEMAQAEQRPAEESDNEEESKTAIVAVRKAGSNSAQPTSATPSSKPKKIANGDFLSMYLTEREGKKKKKKKKKGNSGGPEAAD
ncbi:hypothetical protein INT43_004005, partial [Umbelopsis isabellina]